MTDRLPRRWLAFGYGLFAYALGLATVAYAVGFLANAVVPKSVDAGGTHSLGEPLVANLALIGLFGLQHSLMARPGFKERWTRLVPEPVERSTYVLVGVKLEERDLVAAFGDRYRRYRAEVPMFVPRPWRSTSQSAVDADAD